MKITTKYGSIERQIFEFDLSDIQAALMKYANIVEYRDGRKVELDVDCGNYDLDTPAVPRATITLVFEKAVGEA